MTSAQTMAKPKDAGSAAVEEEGPVPGKDSPTATTPAAAVPAAAGQLAVIFTPEQNESCLQSCRGGAIAWAFGTVNNPTILRINPGLNAPVPRDLWARAKDLPETQMLLGRGLIQEIELTEGTANADGEVSLAAVSVQLATRLIYGCRNLDQLERWRRKEDRQAVREKLASRIKEIEDGRP
jgi:hypothetical protein